MDAYDSFSSEYDRFVNWQGRLAFELPFIEKILVAVGGSAAKVLDSACGTGMHAIELARRGYLAAGADLSQGMIAQARSNAAAAGVPVHFEPAGFGGLEPVFGFGAFDSVLCLGNSLPHLLSAEEVRQALQDFSAVLRPGGVLVLQNRNFDALMRSYQRWMEPQSAKEGETEWIFLRFYDFLPSGLIQFNILTLKRDGIDSWKQRITSTLLRAQMQDDLIAAINGAGFGKIQSFGSLGGEPFDPSASANLVITAWKV
ncbi:MAG TPA: class I SAM-dependent methyltransferase [Anaerolineaceae bacterium]